MNQAVKTFTLTCPRCNVPMALHSTQMAGDKPMNVFYCAICNKYAAASAEQSKPK